MKRSKKSFKSIKSKRKRIPKQRKKIKHTESPAENIPEILSPKNTTQYLISNNSSSFYPEEDDDLDLNINNPFAFQIEPYEKIIQKQNQSSGHTFKNKQSCFSKVILYLFSKVPKSFLFHKSLNFALVLSKPISLQVTSTVELNDPRLIKSTA